MYKEGQSAGFEIFDQFTQEKLFTMDIDVNRPISKTKIYNIEGLHFCGVMPIQMIVDILVVLSSNKIFQRIKDLIDLYYISKVFEFNKSEVLSALKKAK